MNSIRRRAIVIAKDQRLVLLLRSYFSSSPSSYAPYSTNNTASASASANMNINDAASHRGPSLQPGASKLPEPLDKCIVRRRDIGSFVWLSGKLESPVLSGFSSAGDFWAAIVVIHQNNMFGTLLQGPRLLRMPILVKGDLAWTAASKLNIHDKVYVRGQFVDYSANPPLQAWDALCRSHLQVFRFFLYFTYLCSEFDLGVEPWKDLLANPDDWWDLRKTPERHRSCDFEHKETCYVLSLSRSPDWVKAEFARRDTSP
ncbi:hypothetical protein ACFE04_021018 [Oxalis oulophora]